MWTTSDDNKKSCINYKTYVERHQWGNKTVKNNQARMQGGTEAQRGELGIWSHFLPRNICWFQRKQLGGQIPLVTAWGDRETGIGIRLSKWQWGFLVNLPHFALAMGYSRGERWTGRKQILAVTLARLQIFHFEIGSRSRSTCYFCLKFQNL